MADPHLVLASASPRRSALLERLGLHPERRPSDVDEAPIAGESPREHVLRLATAKAARSVRADRDEVVLAADTTVVLGDRFLGKPRDAADATRMLTNLSGRWHAVLTGIVVLRGQRSEHTVVSTMVTFRTLTPGEIAWYVGTGEPLDKAGAYGLQGAGAVLVDRIDGSPTNVIGLCLPATVTLLRQVGLDVLRPTV